MNSVANGNMYEREKQKKCDCISTEHAIFEAHVMRTSLGTLGRDRSGSDPSSASVSGIASVEMFWNGGHAVLTAV